jgi:hypothetical protein
VRFHDECSSAGVLAKSKQASLGCQMKKHFTLEAQRTEKPEAQGKPLRFCFAPSAFCFFAPPA